MSYSKIITDVKNNSPINASTRLTVEEKYDLFHHTHKLSDIIGVDNSGSVDQLTKIAELEQKIANLEEKINALSGSAEQISNTLDGYVIDYEPDKEGIQNEHGVTVEVL